MFELSKHLAHNGHKSTYDSQKSFINFCQPKSTFVPTKNSKNNKYTENCNFLGSKTLKNDHLTLNYGFPSSFNTLSF